MVYRCVTENSNRCSSLFKLVNPDYIIFVGYLPHVDGETLSAIIFSIDSNTLGLQHGKINWNLMYYFSDDNSFSG